MSNAIVCLTHNLPPWSEISLRRLREYAERIGVPFIQVEPEKYEGFMTRPPIYKQMLLEHGRCAFIDADCVVSREAPSIFEHEEGKVWMVKDAHPSDEKCQGRFHDMMTCQAIQGTIGWTEGYGNMGVVIAEEGHHPAINDEWIDVPTTHHDQAQFNYWIRKLKLPLGFMEPRWNKMGVNSGCRDIIGACGTIAQGAYIAHAAGFKPCDRKYAIEAFDRLLP